MSFSNHSRFVTSCVMFSVVLTTLIAGGESIVIKDLRVPEIIKNGSQSAVVLDCDYTVEEESRLGLVVKWFFNQNPTPVYQWIPNQKPQDLGVLRGKLNLDYRASEEAHKMHRALQIINPTTELSGEYKCLVSTFDSEISQSKKMIIFVPEKNLEVTQTKQNENSAVNISCSAEGVFPEPKLSIVTEGRTKLDNVHVVTIPRHGLYDIYASIVVDDDDIESPTTFECELEIPEANYTVKRSSTYYSDSNSSRRVAVTWILLVPLLFFCLKL